MSLRLRGECKMRSLIETALSKAKSGSSLASNIKLEEILEKIRAKIIVIGVGGAGNNTITRLKEEGIDGAETIAVNTDAQDLFHCIADRKILIGKELTKGLGAGNDPSIGEAAARENFEEIREATKADMVFITCGLGGGTGTGAAPVIAEAARKEKALIVAIVTFPFECEGSVRRRNALEGLRRLLEVADTVIVIPNDRLLQIAPNLSIDEAFKVADEILIRSVKGITELIVKPGLVNLDFADVRSIMKDRGMAIIAMGESNSDNRVKSAVEEALNNPLLNVDVSNAKSALINICGGVDMTLKEAQTAVKMVSERINRDAEIIWGAIIDENIRNTLRVTIIISGLNNQYDQMINLRAEDNLFDTPSTEAG